MSLKRKKENKRKRRWKYPFLYPCKHHTNRLIMKSNFIWCRNLFIFCKFIFKLKLYTICKIRTSTDGYTVTGHGFQETHKKIYISPPFLLLSAMQRTSRQLDEMSHSRYHTLSHLSLVQHSLPGSTTKTLSLGFCIDRHRQNHLALLALSCRLESSKVPHLPRSYLVCLQLALYPK